MVKQSKTVVTRRNKEEPVQFTIQDLSGIFQFAMPTENSYVFVLYKFGNCTAQCLTSLALRGEQTAAVLHWQVEFPRFNPV